MAESMGLHVSHQRDRNMTTDRLLSILIIIDRVALAKQSIIQDMGIWDNFGIFGIFGRFGISGIFGNFENAEIPEDIENAEIAVSAEDIEDAEIVSISQILDMYGKAGR